MLLEHQRLGVGARASKVCRTAPILLIFSFAMTNL